MQLPVIDQTIQLTSLYTGNVDDDLAMIKTLKLAKSIVGGLSEPSKMPCYSYNIPANKCKTGGKLKKIKGSVCFGCYAADDIEWVKAKCKENGKWALTRYTMNNIKDALQRRFESLNDVHWVPAMVKLINHYSKNNGHFRWHDSGDVQDENHYQNIMTVVRYTPTVKHWLPTREYGIVTKFDAPDNLVVRLSAHMVDGKAPSHDGFETSTVSTGDEPKNGGHRCEAAKNDNQCLDCRKCWNKSVENIDYHHHN